MAQKPLTEAQRLDREIVRLVRAEIRLDRDLAIGLAILWDQELYRPLGYARAIDFVREQLGIEESRARWLACLGRHLRTVPELDAALLQGTIGASHVIELGRILNGKSKASERQQWIARAAKLNVRALKKEVQVEVEKARGAQP